MIRTKFLSTLCLVLCLSILISCRSHYTVQSIEGSRILIDSTWDEKADPGMITFVNSYKTKLEAEMNVVVGECTRNLDRGFPQSLLTNLTADAMLKYGIEKMGGADFAVVNVHGHRASLSKGTITIGNLFEVYSFDNKLVLLELDGKQVSTLFRFYATNGGEGLSGNVKLKIKDKKIESLEIGGYPVDNNKLYRIVTLDYLAEGNGGMEVFQKSKNYTDSEMTLRDMMIDYVRTCTANHQSVNSKLDDRIVIEK